MVSAFLASRLTRNYTPSLPLGVYLLRPGAPITKGDIVDFPIPQSIRSLVAERRYLPLELRSFHLLKSVVALPGDHVCFRTGRYEVNGRRISEIATVDSRGRPLQPFSFCGSVPPGFAFVATLASTSLDSRYFGPVPIHVLTVARPLWTS